MIASIERNNCAECEHRMTCVGAAAGNRDASQRIRIARHAALYQAGDAVSDHIFNIRSGSFKVLRAASQQPAHIIGFALAPDFLGLDALDRERHANTVIALEDSEVCSINWNRHAFEGWRRPVMRASLHALLSREIRREQRAALMLRNTQAEQRMADLLLSLSQRRAEYGHVAEQFRLPMSRCDIASYLGVTAECVSRLLLLFRQRALFELRRRDIKLLDLSALRRMAIGSAPEPAMVAS
ncbi:MULTISPECIES: Crp/Fnr family transcriptional regulator [unclassified Duganella]|uniref:Crp/Fnr family transcriptional regulator n=1 Tax=unclassified Duganella TaxID=2636909 RepID=UPI000E34FC7E|nr:MULTISPECIES: helix-turn-helix domain-containing protein [unclassified Duganella]RFP13608.1 transcriptional regulator [Duganella sp. BJB475]RFP36316.1 transcriptional regulator [Duganella sp. BJB476]